AATFVLHVAASEESLEAGVSVRPPGPNIYLSECVLLQCTVESHCTSVKSYRWYRAKPLAIPNRRHLVSGDSYYISAVTREDADSYWCQAKCQENKTVLFVDARPVTLSVSGEQQRATATSAVWHQVSALHRVTRGKTVSSNTD
ncbi:immunoglobulin superfamily member 10-like isoform X1, partial [Solea senegalensis]